MEETEVAGAAVRGREEEECEESVGVRGGLEEGRTGRSSSMSCGVTAMEDEEDEEEGG